MSMKVSASPKVARMPGVAREKARAASSRRKASSCASMTARTARASSGGTASARCGAKARSSAPRKRAMTISDAEQLLEGSRGRADRLRIGALLGLVLRGGKAVAGAAVDLVLEGDLRAAQLLDQTVDCRERKARILGAVQGQEHALGVRRPSRRALARMDHQHGRPPAGHLIVVDQIGFELGAALVVFDPLVLHLGLCRADGERDGGGEKRCKRPEYRHGSLPSVELLR